jgi:hypothetical protein
MPNELIKLPLLDLERYVDALVDAYDQMSPEEQSDYAQDLQAGIEAIPEKRDRISHVILFLLSQADLAKAERERQTAREKSLRRQADRLKDYVLEVIIRKGKDPKTDRYKKLEGNTSTLSPVKCPPSVDILDPMSVPYAMRRAVVKMAGQDWIDLCYDKCKPCRGTGKVDTIIVSVDPMTPATCVVCGGRGKIESFLYELLKHVSWPESEIQKTPIKEKLEKGEQVPGARLVKDKLRLEIL